MSECDLETSTVRRLWPTRGIKPFKKIQLKRNCSSHLELSVITFLLSSSSMFVAYELRDSEFETGSLFDAYHWSLLVIIMIIIIAIQQFLTCY